ncbi:hypoxanthine-guanine phosphoribosyltransferase, partial [Mortierella sp. GBA43]
RTFLKKKNNKNISIQAIGLSLYEDLEIWRANQQLNGGDEEPGVIKTQWLNFDSSETSLIGRNILIVDEVDDTRRTLAYAVRELTRDLLMEGKEVPETKIGVFVLHNKEKPKREELPDEIMNGRYFACKQMPDQWLVYPWDALDIEDHTARALENPY